MILFYFRNDDNTMVQIKKQRFPHFTYKGLLLKVLVYWLRNRICFQLSDLRNEYSFRKDLCIAFYTGALCTLENEFCDKIITTSLPYNLFNKRFLCSLIKPCLHQYFPLKFLKENQFFFLFLYLHGARTVLSIQYMLRQSMLTESIITICYLSSPQECLPEHLC